MSSDAAIHTLRFAILYNVLHRTTNSFMSFLTLHRSRDTPNILETFVYESQTPYFLNVKWAIFSSYFAFIFFFKQSCVRSKWIGDTMRKHTLPNAWVLWAILIIWHNDATVYAVRKRQWKQRILFDLHPCLQLIKCSCRNRHCYNSVQRD